MTSVGTCHDFDELLSAYVDRELSDDDMRLVDAHTRDCDACLARLRRMQRLAPELDLELQALLNRGELAARRAKRSFRPPPELMLAEPSGRWLARLSTMAVLVVFALLAGVVMLRSAPGRQQVQTADPPVSQTVAQTLNGSVIGISISGLVDPPTVGYVHRALQTAEQQHATLLLDVKASGGLDASVEAIERDLAAASIPTYAHVDSTPNSTTLALVQSTGGSLTTLPPDATWLEMDFGEAVWHRILDPTTAYVFFVLGLYAVFIEIAHPGSLVPGISGVMCMAIAGLAFTTLPTNWLGVCTLVAGVGLMAVELKAARHGMLMLCGVICLAAGSLVLYAPALSGVVVAPAVLLGVVFVGVVLGVFIAGLAQRVHRLPPLSGLEHLVGAHGVARTGLNPDGVVHVQGQAWSAHARGGPVVAGEPVRVLARRGLILDVESASYRAAATRKGTLSWNS